MYVLSRISISRAANENNDVYAGYKLTCVAQQNPSAAMEISTCVPKGLNIVDISKIMLQNSDLIVLFVFFIYLRRLQWLRGK